MKLALVLMAALAAGDLDQALRPVAHDRSPRTALAAARSLASAPVAELAALLRSPERLAAIAPEPVGRERVELVITEALAGRRDPAAAPVLREVFGSRGVRVAAAAARGLGRMCAPEDLQLLGAHARPDDPRDAAALEGLSACRAEAAAEVIAARLDAASDPAELDRLAQAAGRLGSSWAWQALGAARAQEGFAVRRRLASSLAAAESRTPRPSLAFARRMVGQPSTAASLPGGPEAGATTR